MTPLVLFDQVICRKNDVTILNGLSLSIDPGEMVTVLGRSGTGKSTLLRLAIGLDELNGGSIQFREKEIREWNLAELRRCMGMVLQLPYLFPGTVEENLLYGPRIHKRLPPDISSWSAQLLQQVGLSSNLVQRRTSDLSVGQQMRVSLARTLANQPEILLLDEPTASLDQESERHILNLIIDLHRKGGYTIICVTHKIDSARTLGGRSIVLENGRVSLDGPVDQVLRQSDSRTIQSLFSGESS